MDLTIHVPNLDRRQDRWYVCLGALLVLDYSEKSIRRVSARDGNDYKSYEHGREAALSQCPPSLFISDNWLGAYYYYWAWTWYEIMVDISTQTEGSYHLVIIDDWSIAIRYAQLCDIIGRVEPGLKMIQFYWSRRIPKGHTPPKKGAAVENTGLRHGITSAGEHVTLFTPRGAKEALKIMNRPEFGTPEWVPYFMAKEGNPVGLYSPAGPSPALCKYLGAKQHIDAFQDGRLDY